MSQVSSCLLPLLSHHWIRSKAYLLTSYNTVHFSTAGKFSSRKHIFQSKFTFYNYFFPEPLASDYQTVQLYLAFYFVYREKKGEQECVEVLQQKLSATLISGHKAVELTPCNCREHRQVFSCKTCFMYKRICSQHEHVHYKFLQSAKNPEKATSQICHTPRNDIRFGDVDPTMDNAAVKAGSMYIICSWRCYGYCVHLQFILLVPSTMSMWISVEPSRIVTSTHICQNKTCSRL